MLRPPLHRLVAFLAFALAVCLPLSASAAIVPVCEAEVATEAPAPDLDAQITPSCEVVTSVDDETGETSAAPLCDPAGASAVAPPRIHPIADGSIEAAPSCGDTEGAPSVGPRSPDPLQGGELGGAVHQAVLVPELSVPPPFGGEELLAPPVTGGPRVGFRRGIDHPPR